MRKALLFMILCASLANAQTAPFTNANNLRIQNPVVGIASDSVLVWRNSDKTVRFVPKSLVGANPNLFQVLTAGNTSTTLGFKIGTDVLGNVEVQPGVSGFPASVYVADNSSNRYSLTTPSRMLLANNPISRNLRLSADKIRFDDQSHALDLVPLFSLDTLKTLRIPFVNDTIAVRGDLADQDLQRVTDNGNTTNNVINANNGVQSLRSDSGANTFAEFAIQEAGAPELSNFLFENDISGMIDPIFPNGRIRHKENIEEGVFIEHQIGDNRTTVNFGGSNFGVQNTDGSQMGNVLFAPNLASFDIPIVTTANEPYRTEVTGGQIAVRFSGTAERADYFWNRLRFTDEDSNQVTLSQNAAQVSAGIFVTLPNKSGSIPVDSDVVHTSGTETVDGLKTFTSKIEGSNGVNVPLLKSYTTYNENYGMGTPNNFGLQLYTGDVMRFGKMNFGTFTEFARFLEDGKLGIGTETPGYKLDVNGTGRFVGELTIPNGTVSSSAVNKGQLDALFLTASATLDFPSAFLQTSQDLTITVTGAVVGDVVCLGVPSSAVLTNSSYSAFVSAADTVTVRFDNYNLSAQNPASGTFKVKVLK